MKNKDWKRKNDVMVEDWEVNDISHPRAGAETCIEERKMKKALKGLKWWNKCKGLPQEP